MSIAREKGKSDSYTDNPASVLSKRLPCNLEAEQSVLGAFLLHDEHVGSVTEILRPEDFYSNAHRIIFQTILDLLNAQKRIDIVTLQDQLEKQEQLEVVGGVVYLMELQEDIPSLGLVDQHAKIIKEKAILRELIQTAAGIISNCYAQDDKHIEAVLDQAEKTIFEISNKRSHQSFVQIDIWLKKTFQHLSDIKSHSKGITGVPSGYKKLDQMTSGFQNGDLIICAGRPSMGKTGIAMCIAEYAAHAKKAIGFFSLEMAAEQLTLRLLSSETGIPHHNIRNAKSASQEWVELTNAAARLAEMKFFIDDSPLVTIVMFALKHANSKLKRI